MTTQLLDAHSTQLVRLAGPGGVTMYQLTDQNGDQVNLTTQQLDGVALAFLMWRLFGRALMP